MPSTFFFAGPVTLGFLSLFYLTDHLLVLFFFDEYESFDELSYFLTCIQRFSP